MQEVVRIKTGEIITNKIKLNERYREVLKDAGICK